MKKIHKIFIPIPLIALMCTNVFATNPTLQETPVKYVGQGTQGWLLEVPSQLKPSQSGNVRLYGTWDSTKKINVIADESIVMTNSIDQGTKRIDIDFEDISQIGDNTSPVEVNRTIKVSDITDALFGTWSGTITYNLSCKNYSEVSVGKENYSVNGLETLNIDINNPTDGDVTIENSDTTVADVRIENGKIIVEPKKEGTIKLTLKTSSTDNYYASSTEFSVTFTKITPTVSVPKTAYTISNASNLTVKASNNGDGKLSATSSNTSVATVASDGNNIVVTPKASGTTKITVASSETSMYKSAKTEFNVTVNKVNNTLTVPNSTYTINNASNLSVAVTNKSNGALTVTSSDTSMATVSKSGNTVTVVPKAEGVVTVTVKSAATSLYNSATTTFKVNIAHNYVSGVCTRCGEKDINSLPAGLYDTNWNLKTNWQTLINNKVLYNNSGVLTSNIVHYADGRPATNNSSGTLNGILIIPEEITKLGNYALASCDNLKGVVLPKSLKTISQTSFYGVYSTISSITLKDGNTNFKTVNGVLYNADMTRLIKYPAAKTTGTFTVPKSVLTLGMSCFANNDYLWTVYLNEGLTTIESCAWDFCDGITTITLPSTLKDLGGYAFSNCKKLTSVYVNDGLKTIGVGAFCCTNMSKIYIPSSVTTIYTDQVSTGYRGLCHDSLKNIQIYCGAPAKPAGWGTYWNYKYVTNSTSGARYTAYWGYTRAQFNAVP